eukprot:234048-Prymnesium_polylepis.1
MQFTALWPRPNMHHVFSLKITGLQQEYGWNAVAVVMNTHGGNPSTDDMFKTERPMPHKLWIYSQFTCPWENTLLTLIVSPADANVEAYVEMVDSTVAKKRTREDENAMPYLPCDEKDLWTDLGDGLKH